jgi:hypothetical protein
MAKTQLLSKFRHHKISKMTTVISNDGLGDTKSSNDMMNMNNVAFFPMLSIVGIASAHLVK